MIHSLFNDCVLPSPWTDCNIGIAFKVIRDCVWAFSTVKLVGAGYSQKQSQTFTQTQSLCVQLIQCKAYELQLNSVEDLGPGYSTMTKPPESPRQKNNNSGDVLVFMKIHTSKGNYLLHHNHQVSCKSIPAYDISVLTKYWQRYTQRHHLFAAWKTMKEKYLKTIVTTTVDATWHNSQMTLVLSNCCVKCVYLKGITQNCTN